ncbi:MAG: cohesin domain-containing protein [bacterium]|nr:cohesin domain-containing protein [bacterium]
MKQLLTAFLFAMLFLPSFAQAAGSAELSFSEDAYAFSRGEQFDVVIEVAANQSSLDTVRAVVTFDPNVLMAQDVQLLGAFDRLAPGNYIDNTRGKVSWGAFTLDEPLDTSTSLFSITFLAVGEGSTDVSISSDSKAISQGQETFNIGSLDASSVTIDVPDTNDAESALIVLESVTHSNELQWYPSTDIAITWTELASGSPIVSYTYTLDEDPQAPLAQVVDASVTDVLIDVVEDGIYTFRIQGLQADGVATPIAERVVRVDTTPPNPIQLTAQETQLLEGESAWLSYATTDEASGVLQYQIAMNDGDYALEASPVQVEYLPAGTYFFRVAALDRAGNSTYGSASVRVYPEGTDLGRPEGYEDNTEILAIGPAPEEENETSEFPFVPVISVCVLLSLFALITIKTKIK